MRRRTAASEDTPDAPVPDDAGTLDKLRALNDPHHPDFVPTVFVSWDLDSLNLPAWLHRWVLQPYIRAARRLVRVETDVVMLTHLLLYFTTSVPSAVMLFRHFSWIHGVLHWIMQSYYVGTYTLMMHQHIHMGGILKRAPALAWFDKLFPYLTDPLMGHTWNTYYYHHVKHHHVEGNGPDDLSSTIRYQRDQLGDFLCYVGRFYFFIWLELPLYFLRKGKVYFAVKAALCECLNYTAIYLFWTYVAWKPTLFVFLLPLLQLRVGLMVGNWGQHAFVDDVDPNSDFRSSITLIDVAVSIPQTFPRTAKLTHRHRAIVSATTTDTTPLTTSTRVVTGASTPTRSCSRRTVTRPSMPWCFATSIIS